MSTDRADRSRAASAKGGSGALVASAVAVLLGGGLAWAGSQGGASLGGVPIFALCVGLAFLIQWIAFVPAWVTKTEGFYDLTGSLTYISVTILAVLASPVRDGRSLLLLTLVVIWAGRLGTFLVRRIRKAGRDARFDEIKTSFPRFFMTWTLQGLWVSVTLGAALAAITTTAGEGLDVVAVVGLAVWVVGFVFEALADVQKNRFRADPANAGRFITTGLWAWSRHPNYFGEIVLWIGVAVIALPVLSGWQYVTLISPVFVFLLITRVSGVPLLEKKADRRWGGQPGYEAYKAHTPVLIPRPPAKAAAGGR
jgi:steroid 5-alpha reductase family enzyme